MFSCFMLFTVYRLYLAAMHYNENADRDQTTTTTTGQAVFKFLFPKSKKGECTAKPVKTKPTYSKLKKEQHQTNK